MEIAHSRSVRRSIDDVWLVLADFGAIATWAPNVDHSCLTTHQAAGVGTARRVQVGRNALLEQVVEWQPGERLAYEIVGLPPIARSVVNTWALLESAGATTVALSTLVEPGPRPPQRLAARGMGRLLGRASVEMLNGLAAHVETAPRANRA